jgi:hypothetical protein
VGDDIELLRCFLEEVLRRTPGISEAELLDEANAMGSTLGLSRAKIWGVVISLLR